MSLLICLLFQDWDIIQCILIVMVRMYWTLIKIQWEWYDLARCDKVFWAILLKEERKLNKHKFKKKSIMCTVICGLSLLRMSVSSTYVLKCVGF